MKSAEKPETWLGTNKPLGEIIEISEGEKMGRINKIFNTPGYFSNDCVISIWEKDYTYRNIDYSVKLCRYYRRDGTYVKTTECGAHAVLEPTKTTEELEKYCRDNKIDGPQGWLLWSDSDHSHMEHSTIEGHIIAMHEQAKEDIDWLLDVGVKLHADLKRIVDGIKGTH